MNEIEILKDSFVEQLAPLKVYLFGSYAQETFTADSDFDFYIVVNDDVSDLAGMTARAYQAIRKVKKRPVDILVGTNSGFEARKELSTIENEVYRNGVLLYESRSEAMDGYGGNRL